MRKTAFLTLIFLFCGLFASTPFVRADDPVPAEKPLTFESAFQSGLEALQKKDYAAAQSLFDQALVQHPDENSTLFNLALAHARQEHKGWALAYLRRLLFLDPGHSEARQAMNFLIKKSPPRDIPHQIETWETLHDEILSSVSFVSLAFLSLFLFFATTWSWLTYLGSRRKAIQTESALPATPFLSIAFTVIFALSGFLVSAKAWDDRQARATIVLEKVSALTAPRSEAPSLFELFEGLDVLVQQVQGDWIQVTYPGAMTGWIPKSSLFITQAGVL